MSINYHLGTTITSIPPSVIFLNNTPTQSRSKEVPNASMWCVLSKSTIFIAISSETKNNLATDIKTPATYSADNRLNPKRADLVMLERVRSLIALYRSHSGMDVPAARALNDAEYFIIGLPQKIAALPFISLAEDGEINFFWKTDNIKIDLGMYGDGKYSFYAKRADGTEEFGDDVLIRSPLSPELSALLSEL